MITMSDIDIANILEDLNKYANEKGIIEIVLRDKKKKFETFQKVIINNLPKTEEKELVEKALNTINNFTKISDKNLKMLNRISKINEIGFMLNGLNLCATCVGFAIINDKLNKMSDEISRQFAHLENLVKKTNDIKTRGDFNKTVSDHSNMLDHERRGQPYPEEKLYKLVNKEYILLDYLIESFRQDISADNGNLIFLIMTVLSMLTASLQKYDELYYFNNIDVLKDNPWHLSHNNWMSAYDTLSSNWFIEKLQDYAYFETSLDTFGVDAYYITLLDQVSDLKEEVEDNQKLIEAMGNIDIYRKYRELTNQEIADSIEAAFKEAGSGMDEAVVMNAYHSAMQQAALA